MTLTSFKIERFLFLYASIDDKRTSSARVVRNEHCVKSKISSSRKKYIQSFGWSNAKELIRNRLIILLDTLLDFNKFSRVSRMFNIIKSALEAYSISYESKTRHLLLTVHRNLKISEFWVEFSGYKWAKAHRNFSFMKRRIHLAILKSLIHLTQFYSIQKSKRKHLWFTYLSWSD